jgi:hypothetical protein
MYAGFGTVRPRGQIPGPRPKFQRPVAVANVVAEQDSAALEVRGRVPDDGYRQGPEVRDARGRRRGAGLERAAATYRLCFRAVMPV